MQFNKIKYKTELRKTIPEYSFFQLIVNQTT